VKSVQNELQVVPEAAANRVAAKDDQVQDAVQKRLEGRDALKDDKIGVEVKNGVVRLTGTVGRLRRAHDGAHRGAVDRRREVGDRRL
jgi:osmotically-inducible protein OsmY